MMPGSDILDLLRSTQEPLRPSPLPSWPMDGRQE